MRIAQRCQIGLAIVGAVPGGRRDAGVERGGRVKVERLALLHRNLGRICQVQIAAFGGGQRDLLRIGQ